MAGRPRKSEQSLTLDRIIDAAWELVDREGLRGLSTRRLATALNVKGPALYWHFRNKDHLLNLMIERVLEGSIASASTELPWWEWMYEVGQRQRQMLLSHRDSGQMSARADPTERMRTEIFGVAVGYLAGQGFSRSEAACAFGGLACMVIGAVLYAQNEHTSTFANEFGDPDERFRYSLNAYILGLRAMPRIVAPAG